MKHIKKSERAQVNMDKAIKSFVYSFLKSLFFDGDVKKVISFFDRDAICTGYLGHSELSSVNEIEVLFASGVESGLINLKCTEFSCKILTPTPDSFCVLIPCTFTDIKDSYRKMEKIITLSLARRGNDFRIFFACFHLVSQTGFLEFMHLDVVTDSLRGELIRSKLRFDVAVQHAALNVWEYDIQERAIYQKHDSIGSHGAETKIENVPESMIESGYVHPDSASDFTALYNSLLSGEKQISGVFRVLDTERKKYRWEKITYITEFNDAGYPIRAIGLSTDVTEHVEAQQQLKRISLQKQTLARNALLTALLDLTTNRVLDVDTKEGSMEELKKSSSCSELIDCFINKFVSRSHIDDIRKIIAPENLLGEYGCSGTTAFQSDYLHLKADGKTIWAALFIECEEDKNTGHFIVNLYVENIDSRKQKELKMKNDAELDPLTNTYNRLGFKVLMENILSRTLKGHLSVFGLLDIDDFKTFNDEMGHLHGDAVLVRVAEIFKRCFRQNDIIGRLGGDEFVFLLDNVAKIDFIKKKLHSFYRELHTIDSNIKTPIYVSIGISISPWDGSDFETLYRKADIALYAAKRSGKNRWSIYQDA